MRRLLPLVVLTALLPLGGASASTCAPPDEGEPRCCPPHYLVEIDNGVVYLAVPHPTQNPCILPQ